MGLTLIKNTIASGTKEFESKLVGEMELGMNRSLEIVRNNTLPFVPVKTGRLKGSIGTIREVNRVGRGVEGVIGTNVEYAPHVEFGTSHMDGRYYLTQGSISSFNTIYSLLMGILKK